MSPEDLPEILPDEAPDRALVERIAAAVGRDARPVRPAPARDVLVGGLVAAFAAISAAGGAVLGYDGIIRLGARAAALIFPALAGLALATAAASVNATIPGSRRPLHPAVLLAAGCAVMEAIFFLVFRDQRLDRFVPQGVSCFKAGLAWAVPAGLAAWLVLRRGYAVDRGAAGLAAGSFAGLAGLAVLELHCPNFRVWHVVVWHVAVAPASALAGWAAAYFFGSKRRAAELMQ
jgi:hypothetical protein